MRFIHFVIIVMLGASGYYTYREGYLASFHPLLDPATRTGELADDSETESEDLSDGEVADTKSVKESSSTKTVKPGNSERELAKQEKAERDRLAREERAAKLEASNAARLAEEEARLQRKGILDQEIGALRNQKTSLYEALSVAREKMSDQERIWRGEGIRTREVERQELRDASDAYQNGLKEQVKAVDQQIREKKAQY